MNIGNLSRLFSFSLLFLLSITLPRNYIRYWHNMIHAIARQISQKMWLYIAFIQENSFSVTENINTIKNYTTFFFFDVKIPNVDEL